MLGAPVDLINAGLRAAGVPVSGQPFLGSGIHQARHGSGWELNQTKHMPAQTGPERMLRAARHGRRTGSWLEMAGARHSPAAT